MHPSLRVYIQYTGLCGAINWLRNNHPQYKILYNKQSKYARQCDEQTCLTGMPAAAALFVCLFHNLADAALPPELFRTPKNAAAGFRPQQRVGYSVQTVQPSTTSTSCCLPSPNTGSTLPSSA